MTDSNAAPHLGPVQPDGRVHGVVVAVYREDGRLLMIRRAKHLRAGGKVCFPGGSVELGEPTAVAAVREMKEELGLDVVLGPLVWHWDCPTLPLTLHGYVAPWSGADPVANPGEVAEILWLKPQEGIEHAEGMATNRDFINAVLGGLPGFASGT